MVKISTTDIIKLYAKQDGRCPYCGDSLASLVLSGVVIDVDHVIPDCAGGSSHVSNYCLSCRTCNTWKSDMSAAEFVERMRPYRDGLVPKKDVLQYNKYIRLRERFGSVVNGDFGFEPFNPITIAEYLEISNRFGDIESCLQEILDRLDRQGMSKHYYHEPLEEILKTRRSALG